MAAAATKPDGSANLLAAARHIVRSFATSTPNAADDMLRILSGFYHRLSSVHDLLSPPAQSDDDEPPTPAGPAVEAPPPSEAAIRLEAAEKVLLHWDPFNPDALMWDSPDIAARYLAAVDEIVALVAAAEVDPAADEDLRARADSVLRVAMSRLQDEFRHLMVQNSAAVEPEAIVSVSLRRLSLPSQYLRAVAASDDAVELPPTDDEQPPQPQAGDAEGQGSASISYEQIFNFIRPQAIADLSDIASRMVAAGYRHELLQAYSSIRRDVLLESLSLLGVDAVNPTEVQMMDWEILDDRIKNWIQALKDVVRVHLPLEQLLCDQILIDGTDEFKEECFNESSKLCILQLLNFGNAIAMLQLSTEKIFPILKMYEALGEVLPKIQAKFSGYIKDFISEEANVILHKLGDLIRGMLTEFGNEVQEENSKALPSGDIHHMCRYVMNYLNYLSDYKHVLDELLDDGSGFDGEENSEFMTPSGWRFQLLISCLEANLEGKCKLYEDLGMQYVFLMNNMLYIVQKVKDSELKTILGDRWIRNHRAQIKQFATNYLRASWAKVLSCLRVEGLTGSGCGSSRGVSKTVLKERFKSFNLAFEELYRTQTRWKVSDAQLKEELRISISEKLVPAYRSFLAAFGHLLDGSWKVTKNIKYSANDMELYLGDFFEGLPPNSNIVKRRHSFE